MFTPFDLNTWPRREHFEHYRNTLRCGYSITIRLDMSRFLPMVKERGLQFYPAFVYVVSRVISGCKEMCMGVNEEGSPGYYDVMHPNFTVFHKDTGTFSDLWCHYQEDFSAFYADMTGVMERYQGDHRFKPRGGAPSNFYCISAVPWLDYSGYGLTVANAEHPNLFPVLTFGKYGETNGILEMPFSLYISHASSDGYHTAGFFETLQETLDTITLTGPNS